MKPVHLKSEFGNFPSCAGTGHIRRFRSTEDTSKVTCKRCIKTAKINAYTAEAVPQTGEEP
jgi:hypothetical protein